MCAVSLDSADLAASRLREVAARVSELRRKGVRPHLTTVLVGAHPASEAYLARKHADCASVGIASEAMVLDAGTGQADLLALIARLNADPARHGLLVQLPLPDHQIGRASCRERV